MRDTVLSFLKENQPRAIQLMNAALQSGPDCHAWLFYGPGSTRKKEAAIWMAESLLLEKESLIDPSKLEEREGNIARRIEEEKYADFILLDGREKDFSNKTEKEKDALKDRYLGNGKRKTMLSKEETDAIQEQFFTKGKEGNRKVYIIDCCDNMSYSAANNMLKFLEEPPSDTYAILTVDRLNSLLSTIVSRCVPVPFLPISRQARYVLGKESGIDEEDAFLLSNVEDLAFDFGTMAASNTYQNAKSMLKQALNVNGDRGLFLVEYESRYKQKSTSNTDAKQMNLDTVNLFFDNGICVLQRCALFLQGRACMV